MDERHFEMEVENNCVKNIFKHQKKLKLIAEKNNYIKIKENKIEIPEGEYEVSGFNIVKEN